MTPRLAILVGHSEASPGAKAGAPINDYEYNYWKPIAMEMWRYAREAGLDAQIFLRDGVGIEGVKRQVNAYLEGFAGASVELHFNGHMDRSIRGYETLFVDGESKEWAKLIHKNGLAALTEHKGEEVKKPRDRGLKQLLNSDRGFSNLHGLVAPACLIEPFFGSNANDSSHFDRLKNRYAVQIVRSFLQYQLLVTK